MVSFDPRGVGLNMAYTCPDVSPSSDVGSGDSPAVGDMVAPGAFDAPSFEDPKNVVPFSNAWWNSQYQSNVAQGQKCADPAYNTAGQLVGTAFVARDIKAMAEALGQDGYIRYWGYSYGTLLGATVAAMFPDRVDRVILDGNINPTDYYHGLGDEAVADYDAALEHFLDLCAQAGPAQCAIAHDGLTGKELLDEQWSFYQDLVAGTFTASDAQGNKIDFNDFQGIMQQVIFSGPRSWSRMIRKWAYVYNNRTAVPAAQRRATPPFDPTTAGPIADTESQILSAITCGDSDRFSDVSGAKFEEWQAIYNNRSQYGGGTLSTILFSCSTWLVNAKEKAPSFGGVVTKTPVLFVEGFYDPVTPSESARNSSAGFVGSGIQWHTGLGHCSSRDPSKQVYQNIKSYLDTGVIPDISTIATPDRPAFSTLASAKFRRTAREDGEYEDAVAGLAALANRKPLLDFQYPEALRHAQRDVYRLLRRDASTFNSALSTATTTSSPLTTPTTTTTTSTMTSTYSTTSDISSSSSSAWTSTSTTSSWFIPSWCTPIVPTSTSTTIDPWTVTTTVASTKDVLSTTQSWLEWTTTTTSSNNGTEMTASGANPTWHDRSAATTTKSENSPYSTDPVDPTWADWSTSSRTGSADTTWSDRAVSTTTTTTKTPANPTWSDWAATVTESASSGWDPLRTTATDLTWSATTSTKPKTNSGDVVSSDGDVVTMTEARPSWTDQNGAGVSTESWERLSTAAAPTYTDTIKLTSVKPSTSSPTTSGNTMTLWQTYTGAASHNSACAISIVAAIIVLASFLEF
ncbi:hypothetical protein LTR99_002191 [Exophiala xenobiotica]|uniref:Peptidase S33 tripeptidyl aminopeptidase-like C-terminal domain-containing protein n=1 Tax=Vermiconidia calcicola TaxID=1690605 RepID=A0AAV9QGI3_9PEZI|nr:hypothetical protein LTR72_003932 [Exophiala xenobiotica]KAK5542469.1 hypothetical protein LTR25_002355 [Vermiconidia calcicola]KAK5546327.1 hypothetical protein LTR23_003779 [Chaetothyriales sp. CCFEE 6169]KAK5272796.1 hypothetical protein LTR96_002427 [Exophiala xenobiotica]KAK5298849.1 hypothetical protein LTR14_002701 [Exophiala xenobiotica]